MKKIGGVAEFVLAIEQVFEFALGIVLGAESVVGNIAVTETVDKNEVASVDVHETTAVAELGFDAFAFGIPRTLSQQVVDMLESDPKRPGVMFGSRVGFAFARKIESMPCEYIHVALIEDLPGNQIEANMDESQILELDLCAVGTAGILDTPADPRFVFAMSFQASIGVVWPDSGNSLQDKTCTG